MTFAENIAKVFAFRTIPTTVVVILLYIAVFTSVLVTDVPASVPKNQRGLNLKQAYADLHEVCSKRSCSGMNVTQTMLISHRLLQDHIHTTHMPTTSFALTSSSASKISHLHMSMFMSRTTSYRTELGPQTNRVSVSTLRAQMFS